jgi:hypothetical protein
LFRIMRGNDVYGQDPYLRTGFRDFYEPDDMMSGFLQVGTGVRCARSLP